ncbi:MAG TPA: methionine synthase [Actinomycetales bacterium]|nr:methionine synthase [Actinomycetales bacterium]
MRYSAVGSWPGTQPLEAARTVIGELGRPDGVPHLVELPGRGPGADLVGRGAALLVDMPVDLQPSGWRLVDHVGRDLARARSMLTTDTDALAEAADSWTGRLKVAVAGPWTLAAAVQLTRGERSVVDAGARRDLVESLAEGLAQHVADVRRLVPGAEVVVQLDEPSLPSVLAGGLPTTSGWGRLPAVEAQEVEDGLRRVLASAVDAGAVDTLVHCCAADAPLALLRGTGAAGVGLDVSTLGSRGWESVAVAVEAGTRLWAGAVPTSGALPSAQQVADAVAVPWRRVGLPAADLASVVLTPACGLAVASPDAARATLTRVREAADALAEMSSG